MLCEYSVSNQGPLSTRSKSLIQPLSASGDIKTSTTNCFATSNQKPQSAIQCCRSRRHECWSPVTPYLEKFILRPKNVNFQQAHVHVKSESRVVSWLLQLAWKGAWWARLLKWTLMNTGLYRVTASSWCNVYTPMARVYNGYRINLKTGASIERTDHTGTTHNHSCTATQLHWFSQLRMVEIIYPMCARAEKRLPVTWS